MKTTYLYIAAGAIALIVIVIIALAVRRNRKAHCLDVQACTERWKELQKQCVSRKTWPQAIIDADNLLDDVLKCCRCKGKTPGERLVSAQRKITENDKVWFGHKLRNKLETEKIDVRTLKKQDIIDALYGFREALKDLGALEK